MLNIFKYIPIFSEDFIPFTCREMTLRYIVNSQHECPKIIYIYIYLKWVDQPYIFTSSSGFLSGILTSDTQTLLKHILSFFCLCVRHWCIKRLSDSPIPCLFMNILPQAIEAPLHWWCTGIYVMHGSFGVFPAKAIFLGGRWEASFMCIWTHLSPSPLAHQITLKLLHRFKFDSLPDVAMTQLITLFWASWLRRDLITQYSLHWLPCIASAWWHSLWGCGCHDNLLQKIHNLSLPPSVVQMFTLSWWGGLCAFYFMEYLWQAVAYGFLPWFCFKVRKKQLYESIATYRRSQPTVFRNEWAAGLAQGLTDLPPDFLSAWCHHLTAFHFLLCSPPHGFIRRLYNVAVD